MWGIGKHRKDSTECSHPLVQKGGEQGFCGGGIRTITLLNWEEKWSSDSRSWNIPRYRGVWRRSHSSASQKAFDRARRVELLEVMKDKSVNFNHFNFASKATWGSFKYYKKWISFLVKPADLQRYQAAEDKEAAFDPGALWKIWL